MMDRRESVTASDLGSSAFGISVNNMIGRFNELDRLQELARSAEEDREIALRLGAENKDLKDQVETLKKAEGTGQRNYLMENVALRALQQRSNKTIDMLQTRLKEKGDDYNDSLSEIPPAVIAPIVVGDQWKTSGRNLDSVVPLYSRQMPGPNNNVETGPPSSPTPHQQKRPTHYLPPVVPEHGDTESSKYFIILLSFYQFAHYFSL